MAVIGGTLNISFYVSLPYSLFPFLPTLLFLFFVMLSLVKAAFLVLVIAGAKGVADSVRGGPSPGFV